MRPWDKIKCVGDRMFKRFVALQEQISSQYGNSFQIEEEIRFAYDRAKARSFESSAGQIGNEKRNYEKLRMRCKYNLPDRKGRG